MQATFLAIAEFFVSIVMWAAESVVGAIVLAVVTISSVLTSIIGAGCVVLSFACLIGWWSTGSVAVLLSGLALFVLGWVMVWVGLLFPFTLAGSIKDVQEGIFNFIPSLVQVVQQAVRGRAITGLQQPDVGFDKAALAVRFLTQWSLGIMALGVGALFTPGLIYGPRLGVLYHVLLIALAVVATGINGYCNIRLRQIAAQEPEAVPAGVTLTPMQAAARQLEADNLVRQQRTRMAAFKAVAWSIAGVLILAVLSRVGEAPADTAGRVYREQHAAWSVWSASNLSGIGLDPIWWVVMVAAGLFVLGSWLSGSTAAVTDAGGRSVRVRSSRSSLGNALRTVAVLGVLGAVGYGLLGFWDSRVQPVLASGARGVATSPRTTLHTVEAFDGLRIRNAQDHQAWFSVSFDGDAQEKWLPPGEAWTLEGLPTLSAVRVHCRTPDRGADSWYELSLDGPAGAIDQVKIVKDDKLQATELIGKWSDLDRGSDGLPEFTIWAEGESPAHAAPHRPPSDDQSQADRPTSSERYDDINSYHAPSLHRPQRS